MVNFLLPYRFQDKRFFIGSRVGVGEGVFDFALRARKTGFVFSVYVEDAISLVHEVSRFCMHDKVRVGAYGIARFVSSDA